MVLVGTETYRLKKLDEEKTMKYNSQWQCENMWHLIDFILKISSTINKNRRRKKSKHVTNQRIRMLFEKNELFNTKKFKLQRNEYKRTNKWICRTMYCDVWSLKTCQSKIKMMDYFRFEHDWMSTTISFSDGFDDYRDENSASTMIEIVSMMY